MIPTFAVLEALRQWSEVAPRGIVYNATRAPLLTIKVIYS
jgi:hypothetical protein